MTDDRRGSNCTADDRHERPRHFDAIDRRDQVTTAARNCRPRTVTFSVEDDERDGLVAFPFTHGDEDVAGAEHAEGLVGQIRSSEPDAVS